jgi:hypothetical protein
MTPLLTLRNQRPASGLPVPRRGGFRAAGGSTELNWRFDLRGLQSGRAASRGPLPHGRTCSGGRPVTVVIFRPESDVFGEERVEP